ncbi:MAG: hypothetical protein KDB53_11465, partial [Planctomycetes bacterium]|nr:hypothetical protein [Planctomycetota bacterium]
MEKDVSPRPVLVRRGRRSGGLATWSLGLLALGAIALCAWQWPRNKALQTRVDDLQQRLATSASRTTELQDECETQRLATAAAQSDAERIQQEATATARGLETRLARASSQRLAGLAISWTDRDPGLALRLATAAAGRAATAEARGALQSALTAQRDLLVEPWPAQAWLSPDG